MPNWDSVLREIAGEQSNPVASAFDRVRVKYLEQLHSHTGRNTIAYYSGFLSKPRIEGTEVNDEDKNSFMLCVHELDRKKGLDLILHTPGGDGQATISLVDYLRSMFGTDIRAFVPQLAMSAGTMIACSCDEIWMGKQSSLGPIDPQFGVIAAANLLEEVKRAFNDINNNPNSAAFWGHILNQLTPSFLTRCEHAVEDSNAFLEKTLTECMFRYLPEAQRGEQIEKVKKQFANNAGKAHNTHFSPAACVEAGLKIKMIEEDQKLQDLVLTIHHCYMHSLGHTSAIKITENHLGRRVVKMLQVQMMQAPMSLSLGGPP
jgi:hypothetical protein